MTHLIQTLQNPFMSKYTFLLLNYIYRKNKRSTKIKIPIRVIKSCNGKVHVNRHIPQHIINQIKNDPNTITL